MAIYPPGSPTRAIAVNSLGFFSRTFLSFSLCVYTWPSLLSLPHLPRLSVRTSVCPRSTPAPGGRPLPGVEVHGAHGQSGRRVEARAGRGGPCRPGLLCPVLPRRAKTLTLRSRKVREPAGLPARAVRLCCWERQAGASLPGSAGPSGGVWLFTALLSPSQPPVDLPPWQAHSPRDGYLCPRPRGAYAPRRRPLCCPCWAPPPVSARSCGQGRTSEGPCLCTVPGGRTNRGHLAREASGGVGRQLPLRLNARRGFEVASSSTSVPPLASPPHLQHTLLFTNLE